MMQRPDALQGVEQAGMSPIALYDATGDYQMLVWALQADTSVTFTRSGRKAIITATGSGGGAATTLPFVTHAATGSLSDERVTTAGDGITITNAGTNGGALTFSLTSRIRETYVPMGSVVTGYSA